MVSEWAEFPLEEAMDAIIDYRGKTPRKTQSGIPLITAKIVKNGRINPTQEYIAEEDYDSWMKRGLPQKGDIVLTTEAPLGEVAQLNGDKIALAQRIITLRGKSGLLESDFLRYLLQSNEIQHQLDGRASGTTVSGIKQSELRQIILSFPPLPEQKAIAGILGALDDKIELNRQMNETLEGVARAIFKSWFVDFDPVRAKADGRQPHGMDKETAALFPATFQDSPLGKIPEGWQVKPLPELIDINPKRNLRKGVVAPYVEMKMLRTTGSRIENWQNREFKSGSKFINGDTLLARITPCLENGKTAFVDFLEHEQVAGGSTEYIVLRPKKPLPVEYGYCLARSEEFRCHAIQSMTGTSGRQRVPVQCFDKYLLASPPASIADAFGNFSSTAMANVKSADEQSKTLAAIRDTLLPKLLSGEIRVKDAEKFMEGAV